MSNSSSNSTTHPPTPGGALPHDDTVALFVGLFFVLLTSRGLGELARKLHQPMVLGELLTGIFLGKTVLLRIWPQAFIFMFGPGRKSTTAFAGVTAFCATMFMLVAGLELNLSLAKKNFAASCSVGISAIVIPFVMGFSIAYTNPAAMGAPPQQTDPLPYALFVGVALAITALPVVAKTLRDIGLYTSRMGTIVMSAAAIDDVLGWTIFAIVLVISNASHDSTGLGIGGGIAVSIIYVVLTVTVGHLMVNRALPIIQAKFSWPGGTLGFIVSYALGSAAFALWIGLHNTLGAFIVGIAVGNSPRFRTSTREILDQVVTFVMAPLFFGGVCLNVDFQAFDPAVVFLVFFISCAGKLIGGYLGARPFLDHTLSLGVAVAVNSRGAMELILAQVAIDSKIIDDSMFVALVFMAIVTSLIPGPLIRYILDKKDPVSFRTFIPLHGFTRHDDGSRELLIRHMLVGILLESIENTVIQQINAKPGGMPQGFAIPTARIASLKRPLILVAVAIRGIDFDAPNHRLSQIILLLLIPVGNTPKQRAKYDMLEADLKKEIEHLYSTSAALRIETCEANDRIEFLALARIYKHHIAQESYQHEQEMLLEAELQSRRESNFASMSSPVLKRAPSLSGPSRLIRLLSGATYLDTDGVEDTTHDDGGSQIGGNNSTAGVTANNNNNTGSAHDNNIGSTHSGGSLNNNNNTNASINNMGGGGGGGGGGGSPSTRSLNGGIVQAQKAVVAQNNNNNNEPPIVIDHDNVPVAEVARTPPLDENVHDHSNGEDTTTTTQLNLV
jgi:Kef-type K+ transport system membrane component KefB